MKTSGLGLLGILGSVILRIMMAFVVWCAAESSGYAQVIRDWVARYDGPASGTDRAWGMAIDISGNIYVTGDSQGDSTGMDFATIKYNSAGVQIWMARYNGPGNGDDCANAIALDSSGNIYVTGSSLGTGTDYDYATIKYNSAGVEQWVARYNGLGDSVDIATSIAVAADGGVGVTGYSGGAGTGFDYATIMYDTEGNELWVARYDGPGHWVDAAHAATLDDSGNIYITGESWGGDIIWADYATIKYGPSGIQQWVARYNNTWAYQGHSIDIARDLAVDMNGNVSVTGGSLGYSAYDIQTIQYNSSGIAVWEARWDGLNGESDEGYALALDDAGNVLVAGYSDMGYPEFIAIKYNTAGQIDWFQTYGYAVNDRAYDIAADAFGCIFVIGSSPYIGSTADYATIKYGPAGPEQWIERYNGPANGADNARAVALDAAGNAYVTGSSAGSGTGLDYATIKYAPTVSLTLAPINPPIQIPASGGTFNYTIALANNAITATSCDVWCVATLPNGSTYGPTLGPFRVRLQGGEAISRERTQTVPGRAPAGQYSYNAYVGTYPSGIWSQDNFNFTKSASGDRSSGIGEWTNSGEPFDAERAAEIMPDEFALHRPHPNPFNPATVLGFELRAANRVSMRVYDTAGRLVASLVDGWREAGSHEVTFDGSRLASGVYVVRLDAGGQQASQKMVLMK